MAGNISVKVKDEASANAWLRSVVALNEDYHNAMREAGETLEGAQNMAEGTVVDEIVNVGTGIINAAKSTFDAINTIADTVNTVLGEVSVFKDVAGGILGAVSRLFG